MAQKNTPIYFIDSIFQMNYASYDFKPLDLVGLEKFSDTSGLSYIDESKILEDLSPQPKDKNGHTSLDLCLIDAPYLPGNILTHYFPMPLDLLRKDVAKDLILDAELFKSKYKKDRFSEIELLLLAKNLLLEMERFHRHNFLMIDVRDNNFILNPKELTIKACDFGGIVLENLAKGMSPNNIYLYHPKKLLDDLYINKRFNVYSIGVMIGIMFGYIELKDIKNIIQDERVLLNQLLAQRYQFKPENVNEFIRDSFINLIKKMLHPNEEIRYTFSQCIDMLNQIIINFCEHHPEYIKANKSNDSVLWKQLDEILPHRKKELTTDTIIKTITPLYKNWETKSKHDRKVVSSETKKILVHELSNCNPQNRKKIAQELRKNSFFGKSMSIMVF